MHSISNKLIEAQQYALSISPQVGGFPFFAQALCQAGVEKNRWFLPSCQAIYFMKDGQVVQQGNPLISGTFEVPKFDQQALISAIREDQKGNTTFQEFLKSAWQAGVVRYDVDFMDRKVFYYGVHDEIYMEEYQAVKI